VGLVACWFFYQFNVVQNNVRFFTLFVVKQ
jgi:hypothetical protein